MEKQTDKIELLEELINTQDEIIKKDKAMIENQEKIIENRDAIIDNQNAIIEKQDALINAINDELRDAQKEAEYYRGIIEGYRRVYGTLIGTGVSNNEN